MFARRAIQNLPLRQASRLSFQRSFSTSDSLAKTVIVTGAAQGIGRAIAVQLAQDGYDVCVNDIESKKQAVEETCHEITSTHARKALPATADVSSYESVESLVQKSVNELGPLSTMVANAGIVHISPIIDTKKPDHDRIFAVNYFGVYNCYAAAAQQFLKQGPPPDHPLVETHPESASKPHPTKGIYKLIGAGSVAGCRAFPNIGHYAASKWAVRGLTQSFALELGRHGITCNNYAPGIVGTPMWSRLDTELGEMYGREKGATMKMEAEKATLGRVSVPEDVAGTVSWLASPGSDFVTGQTVVVDGGTFMT